MFERTTEAYRKAIFSARYMALRVGSAEIGTEHVLLGLLRTDKRLAHRFVGTPRAAEEFWKIVEAKHPAKDQISPTGEIPLSDECKRVLTFAAEEADLAGSLRISTQHLLLGLLRENESWGAQMLSNHGVHPDTVREDLTRLPHDDSKIDEFPREQKRPDEVIALRSRIQSIRIELENALGNHDFATARKLSDEEGVEREKLFLFYRKLGLNDWLYE